MNPLNWKYGNCLLGALYLKYRFGGRLRALRRKGWCRGRHYVCLTPDGQLWHFKRERNLLPWPLSDLFFKGKFESMTDRRATRAHQ